jgi:phosphoesterase, MJ0936 family
MRVAVISDIHGNLPALESVMDDIAKRKVDSIVCLGDLMGKGPNSKEVIDICRKECEIIVQGNWDDGLYTLYKGNWEMSEKNRWYVNSARPDQLEYLGTLPHIAEIHLNGKLVRFFHAHPYNFNRYFQDSPIEKRLELFNYRDSLSDVAVYGDIHNAYMQVVQNRILINVGSVGNPLDITQASYVILDNSDVQFIRVAYDIEKAVMLAKEYNVPDLDGYISELRTAKYFSRKGS